MTNDNKRQLIEYFKKNIKKKYSPDSLKWALIRQGYSRTVVEAAIDQAHKELAESAPVMKEKPIITHAIIDENDQPIMIEKPFWKKFLGL